MGFVTGLELLLSGSEETGLSTGSPELDRLLGGITRDRFYYFYGDPELLEDLFRHLLVNALKPTARNSEPRAVYILCGNYRVEKTLIETEPLTRLLVASGMAPESSLNRIHVLTASSADQQSLLAEELERLLEREPEFNLVLVRGIYKLQNDDARVRERRKVGEEIQRSIVKLRQICAGRKIPLVASGRAVNRRRGLPQPEGSSFLKHIANVIVYLRRREKTSEYNRAFVVKNPAQGSGSVEYRFEVREEMGRSTPPFRVSFQEMVSKLRREFKDALLKLDRRDAFEKLVEVWSSELGAMSYAESLTLLDLMLLVAAVDNRAHLSELLQHVQTLDERVGQIEEKQA